MIRKISPEENWFYVVRQHWITGAFVDERIYRSDFPTDEEFIQSAQRKETAIHHIATPKFGETGRNPNFGTRPNVRKRRKEIYGRYEQIVNGKLIPKMLSEEYELTVRTIEEDLRALGIARK